MGPKVGRERQVVYDPMGDPGGWSDAEQCTGVVGVGRDELGADHRRRVQGEDRCDCAGAGPPTGSDQADRVDGAAIGAALGAVGGVARAVAGAAAGAVALVVEPCWYAAAGSFGWVGVTSPSTLTRPDPVA